MNNKTKINEQVTDFLKSFHSYFSVAKQEKQVVAVEPKKTFLEKIGVYIFAKIKIKINIYNDANQAEIIDFNDKKKKKNSRKLILNNEEFKQHDS